MPWFSSFAARQVPFATFAKGTNRTRHAHCLIAPTGRTRRDPDHRVTGLRRGVAESPSADNARGWDDQRAQDGSHATASTRGASSLYITGVTIRASSVLETRP